MSDIRTLIVDDEPLARQVLTDFIAQIPGLYLAGTCQSALQARELIQAGSIDLLLLDINMPGLNGLGLIRSLSHPPKVIFTTAYAEHAVEGFELDAIDYLLKPFSFDRFLIAIDKAKRSLGPLEPESAEEGVIMVKADKKLFRLKWTDILFLEAVGDYVRIHTHDKRLVTKETMKKLESRLSPKSFIRIHKSYLCRLEAIDFLEGNQVSLGPQKLPIGQTYKAELLKRMGS